MTLWAVSMVKDEMDILPYTIEHLLGEGVDRIIVADNMSTDGTWEWLQDARTEAPVECYRDEEVGYYQSRKMTALAHRAFDAGADWVVPFDADEFWYVPGLRLADVVERQPTDAFALKAHLYNYFPTSRDDESEPNPFARITYRSRDPAPLPKVIVRNHPSVLIAQGNHDVPGVQLRASRVMVGHFPWRTPIQFEQKVRNGYLAYLATDLPPDVGAHWRQYGEILHTQGVPALRDIFYTWFFDPPEELERKPVPLGLS